MSYIHRHSVTLSLSTLGAVTGYSTVLNGEIKEINVSISKAIGANGKVTVSKEGTTATELLVVTNPSTLGGTFYPHTFAQGTTGNTLGSSTPVRLPMADERAQIVVATSSGLSGESVTAVFNMI